MIDLAIPSVEQVVKVGYTIADIQEGINAKVKSVGIIVGSNEMGLTELEYNQLPDSEKEILKNKVRERILNAGADAVLGNITELHSYIDSIN